MNSRGRVENRIPQNGQSLIDILVGTTIGVILIFAAVTAVAPALKSSLKAGNTQTASWLATGLLDNIRAWSDGDWHKMLSVATGTTQKYFLITSSSPYTATTGAETILVTTTTYSRYFYVTDVYRTGAGNVTSSGSYDPSTKLVTVTYGWIGGTTSTISEYLTRNSQIVYNQTDWTNGPTNPSGVVSSVNYQFATSTNINFSGTPGSIVVIGNNTTGTLDSATYDTGVTGGAQFNSIEWQGASVAGGSVQFQLAVNNVSSGPWGFTGSDGTINTYYTPSGPGVPLKLNYALYNNYRYFRYRISILSGAASSPRVDNVIVGWSP